MFCLAGIGGRVSGIMETTRSAAAVLAIDGCTLDCARKCLEQAGLDGFSAQAVGLAFQVLTKVEWWARTITGVLFVVLGISFALHYIFGII